MSPFQTICDEFKEKLKTAIMAGPINEMEMRINAVLVDFESKVMSLADDEALKRARVYYEAMEGPPDGEPLFTKDDL